MLLTQKSAHPYSFRHAHTEGCFASIGFNPISFDLIGTNICTGRQSLENHYVRRGIIDDPDALNANSGLRKIGEGKEADAKLKEIERRERRGYQLDICALRGRMSVRSPTGLSVAPTIQIGNMPD